VEDCGDAILAQKLHDSAFIASLRLARFFNGTIYQEDNGRLF